MHKKNPVLLISTLCLLLLATIGIFVSCSEPQVLDKIQIPAPALTTTAKTYVGAQEVVLISDTIGVRIYHTLDDTDPALETSTTRKLYEAPIVISNPYDPTTLRAVAVKDGISSDAMTPQVYIIKYVGSGERGPAGGFVFSSGIMWNDLRYLEAAPHGWNNDGIPEDDPLLPWGKLEEVVPAARRGYMGSGVSNTDDIVAFHSEGEYTASNVAAIACAEYTVNHGGVAYSDWYLPSSDELYKMYIRLLSYGDKGGFVPDSGDDDYWSSTEKAQNGAGYTDFSNGSSSGYKFKDTTARVRPVRAF